VITPHSETIRGRIPGPVRSFLIRSVIFFVAWKILYLALLLPHRTLDRPLTDWVGKGASWTLNAVAHRGGFSAASGVSTSTPSPGERPVQEKVSAVSFHNERVLAIADVCNGLELMVLYAAFIICLPAAASRKTVFIAGGLLLIFAVNILRCTALVFVYLHYRDYTEFFHHYVFTFLVYGFICWLWFLFSRTPGPHSRLQPARPPGSATRPAGAIAPGSAGAPASSQKIRLDVQPR
jgi:exosortase/archaeosortase family protein